MSVNSSTSNSLNIKSSYNGYFVKEIERNAFKGSTFSSITIEEGIEIIGEGAFSNCANFSEIIIPESCTIIGPRAFEGCAKASIFFKTDRLPSGVSSDFNPDNRPVELGYLTPTPGIVYIDNGDGTASVGDNSGTDYETIVLDNIWEGKPVTHITAGAFQDCSNLKSITLRETIVEIDHSVFSSCTKLEHIKLPSKIKNLYHNTFDGCILLTSVDFNGAEISSIWGSCFAWCGLKEIRIPDTCSYIGSGAFYFCADLESVYLPSNLSYMGEDSIAAEGVFEECLSLTSINIPSKLNYIAPRTFRSCGGLSSIDLPDSITELGERAFMDCLSLEKVRIPKDIKEIPQDCFIGASLLQEVVLPEGLTTLAPNCFGYTRLVTVVLPDSLTTVDSFSFGECSSLTSITIPNAVTTIGSNAFLNTPLDQVYTNYLKTDYPEGWATSGNSTLFAAEWDSLQWVFVGEFSSLNEIKTEILDLEAGEYRFDVFTQGGGGAGGAGNFHTSGALLAGGVGGVNGPGGAGGYHYYPGSDNNPPRTSRSGAGGTGMSWGIGVSFIDEIVGGGKYGSPGGTSAGRERGATGVTGNYVEILKTLNSSQALELSFDRFETSSSPEYINGLGGVGGVGGRYAEGGYIGDGGYNGENGSYSTISSEVRVYKKLLPFEPFAEFSSLNEIKTENIELPVGTYRFEITTQGGGGGGGSGWAFVSQGGTGYGGAGGSNGAAGERGQGYTQANNDLSHDSGDGGSGALRGLGVSISLPSGQKIVAGGSAGQGAPRNTKYGAGTSGSAGADGSYAVYREVIEEIFNLEISIDRYESSSDVSFNAGGSGGNGGSGGASYEDVAWNLWEGADGRAGASPPTATVIKILKQIV